MVLCVVCVLLCICDVLQLCNNSVTNVLRMCNGCVINVLRMCNIWHYTLQLCYCALNMCYCHVADACSPYVEFPRGCIYVKLYVCADSMWLMCVTVVCSQLYECMGCLHRLPHVFLIMCADRCPYVFVCPGC